MQTPLESSSWTECVVELQHPDNWIVLNLACDSPEEWAREASRNHVDLTSNEDLVEAFSRDLMLAFEAAQARQAFSAAVFAPGEHPIIALLAVRELSPPIDLDTLAQEYEQPVGNDLTAPNISQVSLPAGSALRVHRIEAGRTDVDQARITEGLSHFIVLEEHPGSMVEVLLAWNVPEFGEVLVNMGDEIATSLRVS